MVRRFASRLARVSRLSVGIFRSVINAPLVNSAPATNQPGIDDDGEALASKRVRRAGGWHEQMHTRNFKLMQASLPDCPQQRGSNVGPVDLTCACLLSAIRLSMCISKKNLINLQIKKKNAYD